MRPSSKTVRVFLKSQGLVHALLFDSAFECSVPSSSKSRKWNDLVCFINIIKMKIRSQPHKIFKYSTHFNSIHFSSEVHKFLIRIGISHDFYLNVKQNCEFKSFPFSIYLSRFRSNEMQILFCLLSAQPNICTNEMSIFLTDFREVTEWNVIVKMNWLKSVRAAHVHAMVASYVNTSLITVRVQYAINLKFWKFSNQSK